MVDDKANLKRRLADLQYELKKQSNWNTSGPLKPRVVDKGIKLWKDLVKYFNKRPINNYVLYNHFNSMPSVNLTNGSLLNAFFSVMRRLGPERARRAYVR